MSVQNIMDAPVQIDIPELVPANDSEHGHFIPSAEERAVFTATDQPVTSLGVSNVYVSDPTHRYAVQVSERTAAKFKEEGIPCEPLTAYTYKELPPEYERSVERGREIDEQNHEIHAHNQRVVQLINPILGALFQRPVTAHPPTKSYAQEARENYKKWLDDPTVRLRESIRYLVDRNAFDPTVDLDDAPAKADRMAADEEKKRLIAHWRGAIPMRDGRTWDGRSARDSGGKRARWICTRFHSFLKPHVLPDTY